jgi:hypothetical protein
MDPGRRYGTVYSGSFVVGADLPDPCPYANDTLCDVPSLCAAGDYADCGTARPADVVLGFSMRCGDGELVQLTFDAYDGCAVFLAVPAAPAPAALPLPFLPSPLHPVHRTQNALGSRYLSVPFRIRSVALLCGAARTIAVSAGAIDRSFGRSFCRRRSQAMSSAVSRQCRAAQMPRVSGSCCALRRSAAARSGTAASDSALR